MWRFGVAAFLVAMAAAASGQMLLGIDPAVLTAWLPGCLFRAQTDLPCPGCGMTHALVLLAQLRFAESFAAHPAAIPTVLAAAIWSIRPGLLKPERQTALSATALVLLLGLWAVRLATP